MKKESLLSMDLQDLKGTYIIQTGDDYYVGNITTNQGRRSGESPIVISRASGFLSLTQCEDYCYEMCMSYKCIIDEDTMEDLKELHKNRKAA